MLKEFLTLEELKKLNPEKIEALQNKRLQATLRHMLPHVAFYREFFKKHKVDPAKIKTVEDWKKQGLPLFKKKLYLQGIKDFVVDPHGSRKDIFKAYLHYVSSLSKIQGLRLLYTALLTAKLSRKKKEALAKEIKSFFSPKMPAFAGGTESGRPSPVLLTAKQKLELMKNNADISAYLIMTRHFDEDETITGMNLFPYAPHIAWQVINMAAELRADLNLCTAAGGFLNEEKLINIARTAKPNVFSGMIDYLINVFLHKAQEEKLRLGKKIVFLNGATKMLELQRRQIKAMFKKLGAKTVIALDGYGASELKEATMAECEENSGLHHVSPLSCIIRTVKVGKTDPKSGYVYDWEFTDDQEGGYAVIWNIDGAGTLLEGFLLGDHYDRIAGGRCPRCGLNVKRIFNVNRVTDLMTEMKIMGVDEEKIDGAMVNLVALREKIMSLRPIKEAQLVIERGNPHDKLTVNYVACNGHKNGIKPLIKNMFKKYSDIKPAALKQVKMSDLYSEHNLKYC
ncbi:MAG: hypothetical protein KKA31_06575, partial [Candidatus Margulisbacteria bacterium]|nr:hypothetical protein [Candidatus Margulisiibacteriota bacterium]